ncbi:hypothetical protein GEV33_012925 [Tenebrio molitor]|uniref:Uncharacterized protein n=1 Tax=Tenebrio molitor TaxID=7067 RepID=A0A8J6H876_TENMO|nr:hypothetical protein GEV33_012925 [Tenebrio molitor]
MLRCGNELFDSENQASTKSSVLRFGSGFCLAASISPAGCRCAFKTRKTAINRFPPACIRSSQRSESCSPHLRLASATGNTRDLPAGNLLADAWLRVLSARDRPAIHHHDWPLFPQDLSICVWQIDVFEERLNRKLDTEDNGMHRLSTRELSNNSIVIKETILLSINKPNERRLEDKPEWTADERWGGGITTHLQPRNWLV